VINRCSLIRSSNTACNEADNEAIKLLNNESRFTRKIISSQDFFAANIDFCAICSTVQSISARLAKRTRCSTLFTNAHALRSLHL